MSENMKNIRVRFAPSPTGDPHLGAMRTALFNWAFAKKYKGKFILRIEDTDKKRQVKGSIENIIEGLKWLGLDYDEGPDIGGDLGPYTQSERSEIYLDTANKLIDSGNAYMCDLTPEELSKMRERQISAGRAPGYNGYSRNRSREELEESKRKGKPTVIRLKVPLSGQMEFQDLRRGIMKFDLSKIDDFVILKADGLPTYHLANVVDDHKMKISHVLRGEEWISSTPKHLLIYKYLDIMPPDFIYLPLIFGKDKTKLSKRHGAKSIIEYKESGLLPSALKNYISLLGWSPRSDEEIMTQHQFIEMFDFEGLSISPSIFDPEKLSWINGVHIRSMKDSELEDLSYKYLRSNTSKKEFASIDKSKLTDIIPLIKERIKSLDEIFPLIKFFFIHEMPSIEMLKCGNKDSSEIQVILKDVINEFENLVNSKDSRHQLIEQVLRKKNEELGLKLRDYLGLIRNCVTGSTISPPLFESIEILGLKEAISRLNLSLDNLKN